MKFGIKIILLPSVVAVETQQLLLFFLSLNYTEANYSELLMIVSSWREDKMNSRIALKYDLVGMKSNVVGMKMNDIEMK